MDELGVVNSLVSRARRRLIANLALRQLSAGTIALLCGAAVLLVLGSDLFAWHWLAVLFAAGVAVTAATTLRHIPSSYSVAQEIDRRLGYHDALSTALHFRESDEGVVRWQRAEAGKLAASADPAAAVPWKMPRQAYAAAGLAFVVLTLVAIRYGAVGSLDLRQPMITAAPDLFDTDTKLAKALLPDHPKSDVKPGEVDEVVIESGQAEGEGVQPASGELLYDGETGAARQEGMDSAPAVQSEEGSEEPSGGEQSSDSSGREGGEAGAKDGGKNESASAGAQGSQQDNSSLMDKMRDAMSNLLSKLKVQPRGGKNAQAQSNQSPQQGAENSAKAGQKGNQGGMEQKGDGSPSADADSNGESGEQAKNGKGEGQGEGSEGASDSQSSAGIGRQDGSKELRQAQQLEAMGKLTELFGQRAKNVTGEVMIEVTSGKQQELRTAYSDRGATHRDAGGEIHRDEIPLQFQHYVQQYFEQVRKNEGAAGTSGVRQ